MLRRSSSRGSNINNSGRLSSNSLSSDQPPGKVSNSNGKLRHSRSRRSLFTGSSSSSKLQCTCNNNNNSKIIMP